MKLVNYFSVIQRQLGGSFTTAELAVATQSSTSATTRALGRLEAAELVAKVGRGKWVDRQRVSRLGLAEFLAGSPTYITAHSALFNRGMIDQIPSGIHAATSGRGGTFATRFGPVHLYQMAPALFTGWGTDSYSPGVRIATPEKALADYFYIELSGNPAFGRLPEVELPEGFSWDSARAFTDLISNDAWRAFVLRRLNEQERICDILKQQDSAEVFTN